MSDYEVMETLEAQVDALETSLSGAAGMAASFDAELSRINTSFNATGASAAKFESSLTSGVSRAIDQVVLQGGSLADSLQTVANSLIDTAYNTAVQPVSDHVGGVVSQAVGGLFGGAFANGAAFSQGRVMPFAKGGVVSSPVAFPMKGATGFMGEAGPEAIMPLTRGADGKLGVQSQGGAATQVVMNITTQDARSFERSQSQIAARMSRVLGAGARNR